MVRKMLNYAATIAFLLLYVGILHAADRPMKLLVQSKENAGETVLVFPFESNNQEYTVKYRKEGTTNWTEAKGTRPFSVNVEQGKYEVEVGPANIVSAHFEARPYNADETLLEIQQWGTIAWESMAGTFSNCYSMNITATDTPNLQKVTSCYEMFSRCKKLNSANLSNWDVSHVEEMSKMFYDCIEFNQPLNWDVSNVVNMYAIFSGAKNFNQSLANWTLAGCHIISLDGAGISDENYQASLRGWAQNSKTGNNTKVFCDGLCFGPAKDARNTLINSKQWDFRGDYEKLGTPKGDKPFIFEIEVWDEENIKSIDLPLGGKNWSFTYQKEGSAAQTVQNAGNKPSIPVEKNTKYTITVKPQGVAWCSFARSGGYSLKSIKQFGDVQWVSLHGFLYRQSNVVFDANAGAPDLSLPADCSAMFYGAKKISGLDLSKWDVSKVENLEDVLQSCEFDFDISNWKLYACKKIGIGDNFLSQANYDKALKAWADDPNTNNGVVLNADKCTYSKATEVYRNKLINDKNWVIKGDHLPHFVQLINPYEIPQFKEQVSFLEIEHGGLTDAEKEQLRTTPPTVSPTGAAVVSREDDFKWKITFKQIGTITVKISVPANGTHGELTDELTFTIKEVPAIKLYANNELVTGNEVKIAAGTKPTFRVETEPVSELHFNWKLDPRVLIGTGNNTMSIAEPMRAKDYTLTVTCHSISTLKKEVTLKVKDFPKVVINGESKIKLYLNGEESEKTHTFTAKVEPATAPQGVQFEVVTPNDGSFEVTSDGKVTAKKIGNGKIRVKAQNDPEAIPAFCEVTVTNRLKSISIESSSHTIMAGSPQTLEVKKGEQVKLSIAFDPDQVDNKNFTWAITPNTPGAVTMQTLAADETGFTFNQKGEFTLTATAEADNNPTASLKVTVKNPATALDIYDVATPAISLAGKTVQMKVGDKKTIKIKLVPEDADERNDLELVCTDAASKVSINSTSGEVEVLNTAQVGDMIKITARTANDPKLSEVHFTIKVVSDIIYAAGITTEPKGNITLRVGDEVTFTAKVTPDGADQTVGWVVTPNNGTLEIDGNGKATAKKVGSVTVKAVTTNNIESDPINITIEAKPELTGIAFVNPAKEVKVGATEVFTIQFTPSEGINKELDVTLEPKGFLSLVSVADGKITVKGEKESAQEITISAKSKAKSDLAPATCKVKVTKGTPVEDALFASIVVAPNPFVDVLRISTEGVNGLSYTLYSTQGNVVLHGELTNTTSEINTTGVPSGLYLLRIATKDGASKTWRIVK
jgi:lipoprotein